MNKTTNYQLNQWERSDRVLMEDFNADNAKIDAAIAEEKAAREAAVRSINTTLAGAVKLAAGSYTGNGEATRTIRLSFTPKAVLVCTRPGLFCNNTGSSSSYCTFGGLAVSGNPVTISTSKGDFPAVEIITDGFCVRYTVRDDRIPVKTNEQNTVYHYIALG